MTKRKRIPYALTNFERIRTENYLYVDKTSFIALIEDEDAQYHFLIRPRKFGKTLFLSVLEHYYDVRFKDRFAEFFGDLYIGQNPTPKANSYFVMNFDFSGLDTSNVERFEVSFTETIRNNMEMFFSLHRKVFKNSGDLIKQLSERNTVGTYIDFAFRIIEDYGKKAYVIIDEYDHFANDIIAKGMAFSKKQYQNSVWASSITRDFYETLKKNSKNVVDKIFITGITPIMLDDVTSGFNISNNLSLEVRYNDILGLTIEEVEWVMEQIFLDKSLITVDLEEMFDGYMFNKHAKNKLFNSTMILNYLKGLLTSGKDFENFVDKNLKTDYGRIRNFIEKQGNKEKVRELLEKNFITTGIKDQFSMEKIHEEKNFFSLLFYMGLVTIDNSDPVNYVLKIPNYSIKTIFWEFIENMLTEEIEGLSLDDSRYRDTLYRLAYKDDYQPFFAYFSQYIVKYLSNRDLQDTTEKDMKFLLMPMFFNSHYYFPFSELENSEGYTDIYLKRGHLHPGSVSEWVWELKYIKQSDAKIEELFHEKQTKAIEQLKRYKSSNFFKNKTDVRYLAVVFVGKKNYVIKEVK